MTGDYIYQSYTQLAPEYFLYDKTIRRICKTGIILLMFDLKDWHNCYSNKCGYNRFISSLHKVIVSGPYIYAGSTHE